MLAPALPPSPDRGTIARLLQPQAIAIVGASERSRWSEALCDNLDRGGYRGALHLINRHGSPVHGRSSHTSCQAVGAPIDVGIIMVPAAAVPDAIDDLAAARAGSAVVLSSGFAEAGEAGRALQAEVTARARRANLRLVGPNSLGFINFAGGVHAWTTPVRAPSRAEGVAIISQSGATAFFLTELAWQQDLGVSFVAATGNETDLDASAFIDHAIDDPASHAIALFIETVRQPARFLAAARRAAAARKPVVVLKVGASDAVTRSAQAHTGALVGDDRLFDGLCEQYGLIRVRSVEQLLATADIAGRAGPLREGGLAILSNSGGICEIAADTAEAHGLAVPALAPETASRLRETLPSFGTPNNPLDLTGGVEPARCADAVRHLADQPGIAAVLCIWYAVPLEPFEESERLSALHQHLASALSDIAVPGFMVSYTHTRINDHARALLARHHAPYSALGLDRVVQALAGVSKWSAFLRRSGHQATGPAPSGHADTAPKVHPAASPAVRPRSEHAALAWLASEGVPVIPFTLATSAEASVAAARAAGASVVLKIASPDIAHKSEIGGVLLNLTGDAAVAAGYAQLIEAARRHAPEARVDGVLVTPMRRDGIELIVGIARDPEWGWVLALGLGGVWVEALKDVALRVLPVGQPDILHMLAGLKGASLLRGYRGTPAADLDRLAAAVLAIAQAATRLGPELLALDINPLRVHGSDIEALDALCVWSDPL
jgi:acyl-CoA synthetase (NDP forming)